MSTPPVIEHGNVTFLDSLHEATPGDHAWVEAVAYGRRMVERIERNKWLLGDLLGHVVPYEDYDHADPHARVRENRGERRVHEFGAALGLSAQEATRYWKTAAVWEDDDRHPKVSWSTYLEGVTVAARPVLERFLTAWLDGRGPRPTVDLIRRERHLAAASENMRGRVRAVDPDARITEAEMVVEEIATKYPRNTAVLAAVETAAAALANLRDVVAEEGDA